MKRKMLILGLCGVCILGLTACKDTSKGAIHFSSNYVNLEVVEDTNGGRIYADKDTGVLYLWFKDTDNYGQTLTPLYNADGSLKNISDFEE